MSHCVGALQSLITELCVCASEPFTSASFPICFHGAPVSALQGTAYTEHSCQLFCILLAAHCRGATLILYMAFHWACHHSAMQLANKDKGSFQTLHCHPWYISSVQENAWVSEQSKAWESHQFSSACFEKLLRNGAPVLIYFGFIYHLTGSIYHVCACALKTEATHFMPHTYVHIHTVSILDCHIGLGLEQVSDPIVGRGQLRRTLQGPKIFCVMNVLMSDLRPKSPFLW